MRFSPGVYFGLDEEKYHDVKALSYTGIKNIRVSLPDYWMRSPYNPARERGDTEAKILGRAFHLRVLDPEAFSRSYVPKFQTTDTCLKSVNDLRAYLKINGIKPTSQTVKEDLIHLVLEHDPRIPIYDVQKTLYERKHKGKIFLPDDIMAQIELSAAMIEKNPKLNKCFKGGFPEVSILWEEDGVPCKARLDYLKPRAGSDLKTFENAAPRPITEAVYRAMAGYKYHIQAAFYMTAIDRARLLPFKGCSDLAFEKAFRECEDHDFYFVFQQKGIAPVARGYKFRRGNMFQVGLVQIEEAKGIFKQAMAMYGEDLPWVDTADIEDFEDLRFPAYACE